MSLRGLLLDFGGVVLRTPFELLEAFERRHGLAAGTFAWRGPFDPVLDPEFAEVMAGERAERDYWRMRAQQVADAAGFADPAAAFADLFELPEEELIRPEMAQLVDDARASGLVVGILTNDLAHFHPPEWIARIGVLDRVDHLVDLSATEWLKPDPRGFAVALDRLGTTAAATLFVDDQPVNLAGAEWMGMAVVRCDVTRPQAAAAEVRRRLCLDR